MHAAAVIVDLPGRRSHIDMAVVERDIKPTDVDGFRQDLLIGQKLHHRRVGLKRSPVACVRAGVSSHRA